MTNVSRLVGINKGAYHVSKTNIIFEHAVFTGADWSRNDILFVVLTTLLAITIVRMAGERLGQECKAVSTAA